MPSILRQTVSRVLTNTVSQQQLFDTNTTGALDIIPGTYTFTCVMAFSAMDAAAGSNLLFDIVGAGTATTTKFLWQIVGLDSAGITGLGAAVTAMPATKASAAAIVTGVLASALQVTVNGSFEVTVAGTIIPSVTLAVGAAANVIAGTYFSFTRIGEAAVGIFIDGFRTETVVTTLTTKTTTYSDGTVRLDKL